MNTTKTARMLAELPFPEPLTPSLRFEGGDVILHMSQDEEDVLILPSKLIMSRSKWFNASLLRWQKPDLQPGATVPTWHYGLVYDPSMSTWTLEAMEGSNVSNEEWFCLPTEKHIPSLYTTRLPCRSEHHHTHELLSAVNAREQVVQSHRLLFAILLDQHTGLDILEMPELAFHIANLLCLAEYYDLLEALMPRFKALLYERHDFDDDIMNFPEFYLGVGEMLRSRYVFEEAMRHYVGRADDMNPNAFRYQAKGVVPSASHSVPVGSVLERSPLSQETENLALKKTAEHRQFLWNMDRLLLNVNENLDIPWSTFAGSSYDPTIRQETRFLARSVWREWLLARSTAAHRRCTWFAQDFYQEAPGGAEFLQAIARARTGRTDWWNWCWTCERRKQRSVAGGLCRAHREPYGPVTREVAAADDADDYESRKEHWDRGKVGNTNINFLGGRRMINSLLRAYKPRMGKDEARRELHYCLHEIVREAGDLVLDALRSEEYPPARHWDPERFYATNIKFREGEMPWIDEEEADEADWADLEQVEEGEPELEEASEGWLKAIGLLH